MRALIETLNRLLAVPHVEGVAFFAPNGSSYCARLDQHVGALEEVAPSVSAWFRQFGSEVRFLEARSDERRMLWFRAGSGALFVAANLKAHTPSLASRIALSIVSLVDSVAVTGGSSSALSTTMVDADVAPLGNPTIPAPDFATSPAPALVEISIQMPRTAALPAAASMVELGPDLMMCAINLASERAGKVLGGPVRRNYLNRARKAVADDGSLDAFELDLDGKVGCRRIAELDARALPGTIRKWCAKFVELVAVIEPALGTLDIDTLIAEARLTNQETRT